MTFFSSPAEFLRELKRRKVFRVAAVYAVVGWLVVQVATATFPTLEIPSWVTRAVVMVVLLGFPVAVVLAWAFDLTPEGVRRADEAGGDGPEERGGPPGGRETEGEARGTSGWKPAGSSLKLAVAVGIGVGILTVVGFGIWTAADGGSGDPAPGPALEYQADRIAVFPFRVSGASEELRYLGEGMVDLLAIKLSGVQGGEPLDPRASISTWKRATAGEDDGSGAVGPLEVARAVGAGQAVTGSVVGTPEHVVLSATLHGAGESQQTVTVEGSPDSLTRLADRVAASLLGLRAGEGEHRLSSLTSVSLPAVKAYLEGEAALRAGRYREAFDHFAGALERDSTFALAGLGVGRSVGWFIARPSQERTADRAFRLAWAHRERLAPADRTELRARAGPRFPEASTHREIVRAAEKAVEGAPDRAGLQYLYADRLFHFGAVVGITDWEERAEQGFRKAAALDPGWAAPRRHLAEMAAGMDDDTAAFGRHVERFLEDVSREGATANYLRWYEARMRGDEASLRSLRQVMGGWSREAHLWMLGAEQMAGLEPVDGPRILERRLGEAATPVERRFLHRERLSLRLNTGRPGAAEATLGRLEELAADESKRLRHAGFRLLADLHWDGLNEPARRAADRLREERLGGVGADDRRALLCALGEWTAVRGEPATARRAASGLEAMAGTVEGRLTELRRRACLRIVRASLALKTDDEAAARRHTAALDSLLLSGIQVGFDPFTDYYGLSLARLYEALGEPAAALSASRRMVHLGAPYVSTYFRERARLAEELGRREEAVKYYRRYVSLRPDPEPGLKADVERARRALERLEAGGG